MKYPLAEERQQWIAGWIKTNGLNDSRWLEESDKAFFAAYHQRFPMYNCRRAHYEDRLLIERALKDLLIMAEEGVLNVRLFSNAFPRSHEAVEPRAEFEFVR